MLEDRTLQGQLKSSISDSVELKNHIESNLKTNYNDLKKLVKVVLDLEAQDFSFLVDMYHYRDGGRPSPKSPSKHSVVIESFVKLVKYFKFLELDNIYDLKSMYGITITVDDEISDYHLTDDQVETIKNYGFTSNTYKEFLRDCILRCDNINSEINETNEQIKLIGSALEESTDLKKKHFNATVNNEFKIQEAIRLEDEKKLKKINDRIDSDYNSYSLAMSLLEKDDDVE